MTPSNPYICIMTLSEFKVSLQDQAPPTGLNSLLLSLWYDAKGDWDKSHQIVQDIETKEAAWIHAYLHRKEGDLSNADYWYRQSGRKRPAFNLEEEFNHLLQYLIEAFETSIR